MRAYRIRFVECPHEVVTDRAARPVVGERVAKCGQCVYSRSWPVKGVRRGVARAGRRTIAWVRVYGNWSKPPETWASSTLRASSSLSVPEATKDSRPVRASK